ERGAGDAPAGVAARLARVVVGALVHDEGGAVVVEQVGEAQLGGEQLLLHAPVVGRVQVHEVAGVGAGGGQEAVIAARGGVVIAGRFEGRLAHPHRVHVEGMG